MGYVPSQPWLCPGTIRDNIVFGAEFSHSRYIQVLGACALNQFVDALALRDQTVVGERGLSLDHSIQVKVTLARTSAQLLFVHRAVYQNCDIYLIDDILKGMDTKSAMQIFKKCICGLLRTKTRLVVTDNTRHTQVAHKVVLMSQDRFIIELVAPFQLLKISFRSCKSTLWTVEKRYSEERAYFKDWSIVFSQMCRICYINTIESIF
ncbi:cystic fibrosis transmembrane conductance regulator [Elysia marginata]|uniref:Cystic fibrosis transmembrane conductance regulator n=1 Tax=Elysia marginata TaxID=1093978 RepID=A0AAV4I946_9GAST|nr:cystic fibrosis transmembrane conductance regulator [Elysia marginata]